MPMPFFKEGWLMFSNGKKRFDKNAVYIAAFILITLMSLFYKLLLNGTVDKASRVTVEAGSIETFVTETDLSVDGTTENFMEETSSLISVYVCGAVNQPGVYELSAGSIINDAVALAGGMTDDAAIERVNLVYIMESNISIYIPYAYEEYESNEIIRDADQITWGDSQTSSQEQTTTLININTASESELMTLPGIGEATARSIIEYREQTPFVMTEDIMNVPGIGEAKYNNIRDLICV